MRTATAVMALAVSLAIASTRMPDGREWMLENLAVDATGSYCYGDSEQNCHRYGRLYTWEAAQQGCRVLGTGWRLPTESEWRQLAKHYGGVNDDATDRGKAAYGALQIGGRSHFNAVLGGGRNAEDGQYARLEAHGFYWTSSEADAAHAVFINFGKGSQGLYRQPDGDKRMAISVRCVRD
jgi:uncharacterized protein (TIGR02145 family)